MFTFWFLAAPLFLGPCGILTTNLCLELDHQGFLYICLLLSGVESSFQVCSIKLSGVSLIGQDYCPHFNQVFPNSPRSALCSSQTSEFRSSNLLPSSPSLVSSSARNKVLRFHLVGRFHCLHLSFYGCLSYTSTLLLKLLHSDTLTLQVTSIQSGLQF